MRTIIYTGTMHAASSIAHGDRAAGNSHPFRRETLILPTGKTLPNVPVISGGSIRGSLRRLAAAMTQAAITDGTLPTPVVHAFRTGGSLRETRTGGEVLTGERQALIRDAIPMFGLFGLTAGGRIMSGRLQVDKAIPVAQETAYLAPFYETDLDGYEPPSVWQTIQRETYTRLADVQDASAQPYIDGRGAADHDIPAGSGNMIYAHETLRAGTRLFSSVALDAGTPAEVSFFDDLIQRWSARARIGGQTGKGLGRVVPAWTRSCYDVAGVPADAEGDAGSGWSWRTHMEERAEDVQRVLSWL